VLTLVAAALALCAAPAGAVIVGGGPGGAPVGLTPIAGTGAAGNALMDPLDGTSGGVSSHGGPVVHGLTTYVLFWDPAGSFSSATEQLVSGYLQNAAHDSGDATNVFSVAAQYADSTGNAGYQQSYGGAFVDRDPYPSSGGCSTTIATATICLYDSQALSELESFVASNQLPTGMNDVYVIATPDTVVTCLDGSNQCSTNTYCGLHSFANDGSSTLLYVMLPFTLLDSAGDAKSCQEDGNANVQEPNGNPGFGDVALKTVTHELIETITDPLLNAWYDANGNEIADICNGITWNPDAFLPIEGGSAADGTLYDQTINGAHYYLQSVWSNQADGCALTSSLTPTISGAPASVERGTTIALSASAGTEAAVGSYAWSFGDGQTGSGQSVSHSYAVAGNYTLTLTVTDAFGNSGSASVQIAVTNPPGTTAGAAGSSRSSGLKRTHRTVTRCGIVRHERHGIETRRCTTKIVTTAIGRACKRSKSSRCHRVKRTTTTRRSCLYSRPASASHWSRRACSVSVSRRA